MKTFRMAPEGLSEHTVWTENLKPRKLKSFIGNRHPPWLMDISRLLEC